MSSVQSLLILSPSAPASSPRSIPLFIDHPFHQCKHRRSAVSQDHELRTLTWLGRVQTREILGVKPNAASVAPAGMVRALAPEKLSATVHQADWLASVPCRPGRLSMTVPRPVVLR
jgi:hypothetical protein